jgi:hypothetical protein
MLEIPVIRMPLNNHIEFEWKFKFWMKIMKVHVGMLAIPPMWYKCWHGGNSSHVVQMYFNDFDICTMLNLMSISLSSRKLMKLHENLVEIHFIWWPPNGFCSLAYWVWCQIQVFVENLCKYMKIWLKYILFGGH